MPKALIVGAGISGLSAAWWLDKAGWQSVIVEKAPGIRTGGYIMTITGLGITTLEEMGLIEKVKKKAYKFDHNIIKDNNGRLLLEVNYEDVHGRSGGFSIRRTDLEEVLADSLPSSAEIRFNETVMSVQDGESAVHATLKSGTVIEADLLVAADGIRSSIRNIVFDGDFLDYLGYSYAVYDIEGSDLTTDCISYSGVGMMNLMYGLGNDRESGLHLWVDDVKLDDERHGFDEVRKGIPGANQNVLDFIDRAEKAGTVPLIDSLCMVKMPKWSKGHVLLLGDAAHCLTLMSGQGACMALASSKILGESLTGHDLQEGLKLHEKRVRPITDRLQAHTLEVSHRYIPKTWWNYHLRNLVLMVTPYSWIVNWFTESISEEVALTTAEE